MLSTTALIKNNTLLLLHRSRNATQEDIAPPLSRSCTPLHGFYQNYGSLPKFRPKAEFVLHFRSFFYAYLGVLPPFLKKSHFYDHINKCGPEISFFLFTAVQNLKAKRATATDFSVAVLYPPYTVRPDLSRSFSAVISAFFCLIISASFSSHSSLVSA